MKLIYNKETKIFSNQSWYALFKVIIDNYKIVTNIELVKIAQAYRASELSKPSNTDIERYYWVKICNTSVDRKDSRIG